MVCLLSKYVLLSIYVLCQYVSFVNMCPLSKCPLSICSLSLYVLCHYMSFVIICPLSLYILCHYMSFVIIYPLSLCLCQLPNQYQYILKVLLCVKIVCQCQRLCPLSFVEVLSWVSIQVLLSIEIVVHSKCLSSLKICLNICHKSRVLSCVKILHVFCR